MQPTYMLIYDQQEQTKELVELPEVLTYNYVAFTKIMDKYAELRYKIKDSNGHWYDFEELDIFWPADIPEVPQSEYLKVCKDN